MKEELVLKEADIRDKSFIIREKKVMLDVDLAEFYGYETKFFNLKVKKKSDRFPSENYMFELTKDERQSLINQNPRLENLKYSSNSTKAFTDRGILMLAGALNSNIAIKISLQLVELVFDYKNKISKVDKLEDEMIEIRKILKVLMTDHNVLMTDYDTIKTVVADLVQKDDERENKNKIQNKEPIGFKKPE